MGDINFSKTKWTQSYSTDPNDKQVLDFLLQNNITQLINECSRQLDVVLTTCPDCVYNFTLDNKLNHASKKDHLRYSIRLIKSVTPSSYYKSSVKRSERDFSFLSFDKGDWKALEESIIECPFQPYCFSDVNVVLELWYEWLFKLISSAFPRKTKHCIKLAPWVSNQSSNLIKVKNSLEKTSHKPRLEAKLEKEASEDLKVTHGEDKLSFESDLFHSCIFPNIQKYLRSENRTSLPSQMYFENTQASDGLAKAQLINTYFQSVFTKNTYRRNISERNLQWLHEVQFSEHDIKNILEQLGTTKAKGADGLRNVFLKRMANVFCKSLKIGFYTIANKRISRCLENSRGCAHLQRWR